MSDIAIHFKIDKGDLIKIRDELERRRKILINLSYDNPSPMEPSEIIRTQAMLERWESPSKPGDIPTLIKQFCVSVFSYAPIRNYLSELIGSIPTRDTIAQALYQVFNQDEFLVDSNWLPKSLGKLAETIQKKNKYDLSRKQFKPRIISVLRSGTVKLGQELIDGIDSFYNRISNVTQPHDMWKLANDFSAPIEQVGPALICDFFKEIGFTRYVKVDHHFKKELPKLVILIGSCKLNPKQSFILSQEIADAVCMTPFHIDSILYLWGRYGNDLHCGKT